MITIHQMEKGICCKPHVQANNFDVVIEATIGQEEYKVLEINNTTGDVNFYEFTLDGDPILDGNNEQTTFVPGDNDFEDRMAYLGEIVTTRCLIITSTISFDLHIYIYDTGDSKLIREIEYVEGDPNDYCILDHSCYGSPFTSTSVIGEFLYLNYTLDTYVGHYYVPDPLLLTWANSSVNGLRIYEDKNGDGEFSDDEEITDNKEKIFNEVANDIINGNGSYEASAVDANRKQRHDHPKRPKRT